MRHALLLVCLVACGEPKLVAKPLPELIKNPTRVPIAVSRLVLPDGERLRWEVHHQGFTIGRAELVVGGSRVTSRFRTSQLASMFARAKHELTTTIAHAGTYPDHASEMLDVDGETQRLEIIFERSLFVVDGKSRRIDNAVAHTLHSALGTIRAWAVPRARPGFLMVVHAGEVFRLDLESPIREDWRGTPSVKVDGRIEAKGEKPILVTMWLTADAARIPIRIAIAHDGKQLDAEKIDD